jgi:hypothetical protein
MSFYRYNVTRMRLHSPDTMPATSVLLTLRSIQDANGGPDFLGAQDTAGNTYAPIVCA